VIVASDSNDRPSTSGAYIRAQSSWILRNRITVGSPQNLSELCARALSLRYGTGHAKIRQELTHLVTAVIAPKWSQVSTDSIGADEMDAWLAGLSAELRASGQFRLGDPVRVRQIVDLGLRLGAVSSLLDGDPVTGYVDFFMPVWTAGRGQIGAGATVAIAGAAAGVATAVPVGIGEVGGTLLARVGARKGPKDGIAWQIPPLLQSHLYVTHRAVAAVPLAGETVAISWRIEASKIARVHKSPRIQMMRRFRLDFVDGSSAGFLTVGKQSIPALEHALRP